MLTETRVRVQFRRTCSWDGPAPSPCGPEKPYSDPCFHPVVLIVAFGECTPVAEGEGRLWGEGGAMNCSGDRWA